MGDWRKDDELWSVFIVVVCFFYFVDYLGEFVFEFVEFVFVMEWFVVVKEIKYDVCVDFIELLVGVVEVGWLRLVIYFICWEVKVMDYELVVGMVGMN